MNKRFNHKYEIIDVLVSLLRSKGYSPSNLRHEWNQDNQKFDYAIVDTQTTELLALFEIKLESAGIRTSDNLRKSLCKYANVATTNDIPLYLVYATESSDSYSISLVTPQTRKAELPVIVEIKPEDFPSFLELRELIISQKRKETMHRFAKISYSFSFILFLFLILDFVVPLSVTPSRLALLGTIIGLVMLPHVNRLKILGFEYERLKDK